MAQEIMKWCDPHFKGEDQDRRPVVFYGTIKIGELERYTELCEDCFRMVKRVASMIEEFGVDPKLVEPTPAPVIQRRTVTKDDQPPKPRDHKCPKCPKEYRSRTGLNGHAHKDHGTSLVKLEREYGIKPPNPRYYDPQVCGIDGCEEECASKQGLGAHQRAKHGVIGVSDTAVAQREFRARHKKLITRSSDKPNLTDAAIAS